MIRRFQVRFLAGAPPNPRLCAQFRRSGLEATSAGVDSRPENRSGLEKPPQRNRASMLRMEVLRPGSDAGYEEARRPPLARFGAIRPAARSCAVRPTPDVARSLAFARDSGLPLAVRSGGHCFAGRSSFEGVVIDVRPLPVAGGPPTTPSPPGAGARLCEVYEALAAPRLRSLLPA